MSKHYIYNGQVYNSDELMHFAYVKKYMKNGNWVYVYDSKTKFGGVAKRVIDTKITGNAYKQDRDESLKRASQLHNRSVESYKKAAVAEAKGHQGGYQTHRNQGDQYQQLSNATKDAADRSQNDYKTKSLAGRAETASEKGKAMLANLMKKRKK